METRGKKVLIFGLGRSGVGAANLLSGSGADVTVTDKKPAAELGEYLQRLSSSVKLCLGGYPERMNWPDLVVVSPGVPLETEPVARAREKGIKVIGELELAYRVINSSEFRVRSSEASPEFLVVTGTNGKSTTTTLLDLMLKKGGFNTILGGNIGNALTEEILKIVVSRQSSENRSAFSVQRSENNVSLRTGRASW